MGVRSGGADRFGNWIVSFGWSKSLWKLLTVSLEVKIIGPKAHHSSFDDD